MKQFSHMGITYEVDDQGCLLDPASWNENFAEGMARECEIPVLSNEHWDAFVLYGMPMSKLGCVRPSSPPARPTAFCPRK